MSKATRKTIILKLSMLSASTAAIFYKPGIAVSQTLSLDVIRYCKRYYKNYVLPKMYEILYCLSYD